MGIGFVILFWFVLCMGVACAGSLALGFFTWWLLRRAKRGVRVRAIVAVVLLPPVSVVCGVIGFFGYGLWCEEVRGVDAGMGDSWCVPLGSGYKLAMIDIPEQAFVESSCGEQFELPTHRLGLDDNAIYFETERDGFRLIEKSTGKSIAGLSEAELAARLKSLGSPAMSLRPAEQVYSELRWGPKDLLAVPMILGLPALLCLGLVWYVAKAWRSTSQPAPA